MYYLQSRYYDPELGRFINADINVATGQGLIGNNMFTYCLNNPVIYSDSSGRNAEALEYWITVMWWLCGVDMTLPFGDIIYSLGIIILLADTMSLDKETQETYEAAKQEAVSAASDILDYASTAATPPPPNKGGKGTQVTSKTLYTKKGKNGFRIDVENPGNRAGQIHLQQNGNKYYYNIPTQSFRIGSSNGPYAPSAIQDLLQLPDVIIAIAKGLTILGY